MANVYESIGIGAPLMDYILNVSDAYLSTLSGKKGGMETVDYEELIHIIENSGSHPIQIAGGSAANTIKGLAALGRRCAMVGKRGVDLIGKKLYKKLIEKGIDPKLYQGSQPTGIAACLVTPDGKRTCRTFPGASLEMSPEDLNGINFAGIDHVHIEGYTLLCPGLTRKAMEMAKNAGSKVSFDLASLEIVKAYLPLITELLEHYVDVVFANEQESFALTAKNPEESCAFLKTLCNTAVVMIGSQGCWVGDQNNLFQYPAIKTTVVDTTGAGDLFASGFLYSYLAGKDLKSCAHLGSLVASEVIQVYGAEISADRWEFLISMIEKKEKEEGF